MTATIHVPVNGKRNVAIDFAIIETGLRARERGLDECVCGEPAVETLCSFHRYIPTRGICSRCLVGWQLEHLLALPDKEKGDG